MKISLAVLSPLGPQQDEHVWSWVYSQLTRDAQDEAYLLRLAVCVWPVY